MPLILTVLIAKLLLKLSRLLGRGGGSALPGLIAERLNPAIGRTLAARLSLGSVVITGTNGKTTTAKMIAQILSDHGEELVVNRAGSNLSRGVVSALIEHCNWRGGFGGARRGLFEVDEASMPAVCAMVQPRQIVVLNLFRDQLDRYGELDTTAQLLARGISAVENPVDLVLNADDPLVVTLASNAHAGRVIYFGLQQAPGAAPAGDATADSHSCPICGRSLSYSRSFYSHLGHYSCPEGHFERPQPNLVADKVSLGESSSRAAVSFSAGSEPEEFHLQLGLPGLYNLYNSLAATAVGLNLGIDPALATQSLQRVEAAFGRVERLQLGERSVYLLLVKNPTGFNQVITTFLLNKKQQNVLVVINDNFADGRDVSWLWDVNFEQLAEQDHTISVSGIRAADMALRLKYAEIAVEHIETSLKQALNQFLAQLPPGETGYIVPTYTALLETRRRLGRKAGLKGVWQ